MCDDDSCFKQTCGAAPWTVKRKAFYYIHSSDLRVTGKMLPSPSLTHGLAHDQTHRQCSRVAIVYGNYIQYSVETYPPVSFVFELRSDDRLTSTAGAGILQATTGGH